MSEERKPMEFTAKEVTQVRKFWNDQNGNTFVKVDENGTMIVIPDLEDMIATCSAASFERIVEVLRDARDFSESRGVKFEDPKPLSDDDEDEEWLDDDDDDEYP